MSNLSIATTSSRCSTAFCRKYLNAFTHRCVKAGCRAVGVYEDRDEGLCHSLARTPAINTQGLNALHPHLVGEGLIHSERRHERVKLPPPLRSVWLALFGWELLVFLHPEPA